MLVVFGYVIVVAAVLGGYGIMGGHFGVLFQPVELLIIAGSALGAFVAGNNGKAIKSTLRILPQLLRSSKHNRALYLDVLALLYELLSKARKEGMMKLESDVDEPENSEIFARYPKVMAETGVLVFLCDYLRMAVTTGSTDPHEIESLMEHELETIRHENEIPASALQGVADALPALGIVAAVLGVVHALASADLPPSEMGALIAHAMVGTFLGVLMAYGFVTPLATQVKYKLDEMMKMYQCVQVVLVASFSGRAPQIAVEYGRKVLFATERPSFQDLDSHVREVRSSH